MGWISLLLIVLTNTTVVIDINGQVRSLLPGETPGPGEVIVIIGHGATAITDVEASHVGPLGSLNEVILDSGKVEVLERLELNQDPTLDERLASAAEGKEVRESSLEELVNPELLEGQGLTEPQAASLVELIKDSID